MTSRIWATSCLKKVSAVVKPSGGDLFDKNIFRAMKAPQNLLK